MKPAKDEWGAEVHALQANNVKVGGRALIATARTEYGRVLYSGRGCCCPYSCAASLGSRQRRAQRSAWRLLLRGWTPGALGSSPGTGAVHKRLSCSCKSACCNPVRTFRVYIVEL